MPSAFVSPSRTWADNSVAITRGSKGDTSGGGLARSSIRHRPDEASSAAAVDAKCLELEQSTTKPPLEALDGAWRVVYSNAPSPSNGALGPLRGDGLQIVDVAKRRYANELRLFGGNARVTLEASFTGDAEELRVTFRSIRLVLFGNQIIEKQFPPGVERTWCLSYTDASCRVVRAGVDGGRSIVREAGLVDKNAGEAKDAYLFFMERAPDYVAD